MGTQRRAPEKAVQQAMRLAANETLPDGQKKIRKICAELVNKAMEGDAQAANIVFDRLDGKPAQQQTIDANVTGSLTVERVVFSGTTDTDPE